MVATDERAVGFTLLLVFAELEAELGTVTGTDVTMTALDRVLVRTEKDVDAPNIDVDPEVGPVPGSGTTIGTLDV